MNKNCIFCDRTQFEERLIAENHHIWIIATLGQITDGGYVLVIPKKHIPCLGAMKISEITIVQDTIQKIKHALLKEYGSPGMTIFEHGIRGQTINHAHLHCIPANLGSITKRICNDFPDNDRIIVSSLTGLQIMYSMEQRPYLFWSTQETEMHICLDPETPSQYLRIIAAEELGYPERSSWRNIDAEFDKKLWSETVKRLKPYFK